MSQNTYQNVMRAFPDPARADPGFIPRNPEVGYGMTLRDYFAAKALAAFIAEPVEGIQESMAVELDSQTCDVFASAAYMMADAMLAARDRETA